MSTQLSPIVKDLELTAMAPLEMVNAQQQLITWCDGKLVSLRHESKELFDAYEHAKFMDWKYSTLEGQYKKSLKKISYYEKIKSALLEGYYIVPNFPIQLFAIRTNRKKVSGSSGQYWGDFRQEEQELIAGDGEYQNPFPVVVRQQAIHKDGVELRKSHSYADEWAEMEFPITMSKPNIMKATSRAMALKIFDRIGVMPATKNEDPVIIGQIIRKNGWTKKIVSFMIAWHLNTNVL